MFVSEKKRNKTEILEIYLSESKHRYKFIQKKRQEKKVRHEI